MALVAGIDSSTQSCKVVVCESATGDVQRTGCAAHPPGTEIDPMLWWSALRSAIDAAGGLDDVAAVSVAGQQHGMVCLDRAGAVVRKALLWNDTRSDTAAGELTGELGGPAAWAQRVGVVPVASITVTKLRWLADAEPANADATAAVCLPHDWLTWRLSGSTDIADIRTDRSDASGTGYFDTAAGRYDTALVRLALRGRRPLLPPVLGPCEAAGTVGSAVLGPGAGDNAAAALGLGATPGDCIVSLGTSGVVSAVADQVVPDPTGMVAGFADATGRRLPLVCTLNGAPVLSTVAAGLGLDLDDFDRAALAARPGADGLVMVPYLVGERSPDLPRTTGALHGIGLRNFLPQNIARAAVEGLLCSMAFCLDRLATAGVNVSRVVLIGGGARSEAVRRLAPAVLGRPVYIPESAEYVARGAARQAAWTMQPSEAPPEWSLPAVQEITADPTPGVRQRYREVQCLTSDR